MLALVSLIAGVLLARYVASMKTVVLGQVVLFLLAGAVLIVTAPAHGSTHAQGLVLSIVLAPLTVLVVLMGRIWRSRSTTAVSEVL